MGSSNGDAVNWQSNQRNNSVRLMYWSIAWVASMAFAAFGPRLLWDYQTGLTVLGVVVNLAIGGGMILANRRYLQGLDEMQRKIFLDASVLSLGVGLVCGLSYELLEDIKLIAFQPEISHLVILMCLTFLVGIVMGHRAYR